MNPTKAKPGAGGRRASQGANTWTATSEAKDTATATLARIRVLIALDASREQLDRYALATDQPEPGIVEAADLLDAARAAMAGAS